MKVRTALVIDRLGSGLSPGEEAQEIVEDLESYGLEIEVVKVAETMLEVFRDSFDLLVIDYGGLGTRDRVHADATMRGVCHWAEDHPGSIVLLWTLFTHRIYAGELEKEFGHIDTIWFRYDSSLAFADALEAHDRRDGGLARKLQDWFGAQ